MKVSTKTLIRLLEQEQIRMLRDHGPEWSKSDLKRLSQIVNIISNINSVGDGWVVYTLDDVLLVCDLLADDATK